jgi:hypothetical protein
MAWQGNGMGAQHGMYKLAFRFPMINTCKPIEELGGYKLLHTLHTSIQQ